MGARVAVIGAGVAGLSAAHELAKAGTRCEVYERWPGLGGQAATLDVGGGVLLERYYHHLFTSDRHIAGLYRELGMPDGIEWRPSSVAFFANGASHPFTTPLDLLRFSPMTPLSRVRLGLAVLNLQRRHPDVEPFEDVTAKEWILRWVGSSGWDSMWGPLLRGKFGDRAEEISMAWLWSKLTLRRQVKGQEARGEVLGYPRGTFEPLYRGLVKAIEGRGGRVSIDRPAAGIALAPDGGFHVSAGTPGSFRHGHDPRAFSPAGEPEHFDAVLATVPNDVFEQLLDPALGDAVGKPYLERLHSIEYHAALCLLLELDRPFSPFYWTNVGDRELPFVGLIEQTNLVEPEHYGGRRFLYVANYTAQGDPLLSLSPDELLDHYEPGLRKVNPSFSRDWVRERWLFCEPSAQPIVTVGYHRRIPALETGVPGLVLANTTQVYPEDRGTNYAVRLGREAAACVSGSLPVE
ncbi:MAG: NAD(P)/FAD-dependent oxidoreductase [Thermoleophilaceae bacterium]